MPIEHELKFVLRLDDRLQYEARRLGELWEVEQGYLTKENGITIRLRKTLERDLGNIRYYFQTKCKVAKKFQSDTKSRIVEIGTEIDEHDFTMLWPTTEGRIHKLRYRIPIADEVWEVDFFKDEENSTYFVMAEVEIADDGSNRFRSEMPKFIEDSIVFSVPVGDSRFSNRKLGNIRYATELYRSLV